MQAINAEQSAQLEDARPILPVSSQSRWSWAAERRDEVAARIERSLAGLGLQGWVRKSQPGEYPLYVAVDVWRCLAETGLTGTFDRSHLKITIQVEPYRVHPIIFTAELSRHQKEYEATYWEMPYEELDEMVAYLVQGGQKPAFFKSRIPLILRIIGSFVPLPMMKEYENELIEEAKPKYLTGLTVLGWIGALAALAGFGQAFANADAYSYYDDAGRAQMISIGLTGLAIVGIAMWLSRRRPVYQAVAKQPLRTPRREFRVDSWQVSVPEAGNEFDSFKRRIAGALERMDPGLEFNTETYQSLTPRGFEERERLVITKGQGNVHVHVQPFGRDAFVGWDSYLNWARWSETSPASTVIREGNRIEYKSLAVGDHIPTKFDLMELNALAETAHRNIVREIKAFLKEKEIEADLDFQIIRGDRNRALTEGNEEAKKQKPATSAAI
ncbi:hypothetical protein CVM73_33670 [Bradyrhizobium forestalis]|uniref:Uncharacterized protein n=1 Tax=Bradyrhizobium forestalis TaxID=1419263 RepID=A0A2M8QZC8_9BRAD|nr:hypothetical protein [Bradyrhizobium forestalis]PJG50924.1 hypothetical protein CVM73_33670 [Bradyrhizobium forestalis]